ncbi:MAG: endonuclease NucS [Candidatus Nezhaarchaeota archaeon]|nr:endonuclease NucS [Candidatus Nezhaarchaeota archaeon]
MKILEKPDFNEARLVIKEGVANGETIILVGDVEVEYDGRASSKLAAGERIVIIKQDRSILVHRPENCEPINWQPPGCSCRVTASSDKLKITAWRKKPYEILTLLFQKIHVLVTLKLMDEGSFSMYASEDDMKRVIALNPSLIEEGLKIYSSERNFDPAGYADFVGEDSKGNFVVVEVKRVPAGPEEVLQLAKYVGEAKQRVNRVVRGILVAPSLRKRGQALLEQLRLEFKALSPEKCGRVLKEKRSVSLFEFMEGRT